ncbi:MAG: tetratricopeptide repeat protein [Candidatus Thermoplasmatota archaeon]|nr:tetratricopeptide repeat protein [Candidatus Thermoplasmatota archaeon]
MEIPGAEGEEVPKLTVDKRILLHLFEQRHSEMDFEVSKEVVQDGIAEAVSVRRDNIPRTMKKLKEEGFVFDVLKRIKGLPRKRKAYFLTEMGLDFAKDVRDSVAFHKIYFELSDGSLKKVYLKDVPSYLNTSIPLVEVYYMVGKENLLKENAIRRYLSGELETPWEVNPEGFVTFVQDVPVPKKFYGREKELSAINEWLEDRKASVLSITGIAGIGKTTLAARAVMGMEGKMHVFWYRFHRWDSLRNLLFSISRFLDQMGRSGLKTHLDNNTGLEKKELYSLIETSFKDAKVFMVFDDFQRAEDEIVDLFSNMKEMLPSMPGVKMMVVGRQVFPFYDRSDVLLKKVVRELSLEGLDKDSCRGLLNIEGMDEDIFSRVYLITKGHPLFLQLILSAEDLENQKDIKRYIYEEIFKKLEQKDSLLLQIASVYRYPAPSQAFFTEEGIDFTTLDRLIEANLIMETSYDEYEAHDLIKEFFYNRLTPQQKQYYHGNASNFYMEVGTDRATVEAMYHMAMGGQTVKALRLASTYGERIITKGYVEQFASVLSLLEKEITDETQEYNAMRRLLTGEVQMVMGRWDRALSDLKRAAAMAEAEGRDLIIARANLKLGSIENRRGNKETAEKRLKRALKIVRKMEDREQVAKSLQALGELYSTKGDFRRAKKDLRESLEIAEELGFSSLIASCHTSLGIIFTNQDEPESSLEEFNKAVKALEKEENALEMARVKISIGTVLSLIGNYDRSIENFEDSIELATESGDIRQKGYALAGAAHVYLMNRETNIARDYLDEALQIFTDLGEQFKIALINLDYGRYFLQKDDRKRAIKALKRCIGQMREMNLPFYTRKYSEEIVTMLRSKGLKMDAKMFMLR